MARNTSKTPAQIAQELQARADAAKIRAAKSDAAGNPLLAQVQTMVDNENKAIAGFARKLSGKNSFANRITSAELRLDWIRAEQALTVAQNASSKSIKDYLQHSMAGLAVRIADGETIVQADIDAIGQNFPVDPNMAALIEAETYAKNAWRAFVAANDGDAGTVLAETV